jgi:hypothetical protein
MSIQAPDCYRCKHQIMLGDEPHTCVPFPAGIPDEIFWQGEVHDHPMRGQKGTLVFEPLNTQGKEPPVV